MFARMTPSMRGSKLACKFRGVCCASNNITPPEIKDFDPLIEGVILFVGEAHDAPYLLTAHSIPHRTILAFGS